MTATTLSRIGGPGERPNHESVLQKLDGLFTGSDELATVTLFGTNWLMRVGHVNTRDTSHTLPTGAPDIRDWHGAEVACLRPKGGLLTGVTRVEVTLSGAPVATYVYGSDMVYNLTTPQGGEQFKRITDPTHYGMMALLLAHTVEFNPGQSLASVSLIPPHAQYDMRAVA